MDHRCLYGHRVPAAFTFAIQSGSCPTCGAPTVTLVGYEVARKLTVAAQLDAVAAFNAVRVIEADWVIAPRTAPAEAGAPTPAALGAAAEEEEVVVDDGEPAPAPPAVAVAPQAPPEPRITARPSRARPVAPSAVPAGFDAGEEDFFKAQ